MFGLNRIKSDDSISDLYVSEQRHLTYWLRLTMTNNQTPESDYPLFLLKLALYGLDFFPKMTVAHFPDFSELFLSSRDIIH